MLIFQQIIFLAGLGFTLAAPLGPVNAEVIKQSISKKKGIVYGLLTAMGALTGDIAVAILAISIGSEILEAFISIRLVKVILFMFNAILLGYIGIKSYHVDRTHVVDEFTGIKDLLGEETTETTKKMKQYSIGFLIVITSPWSYLWWASFGGYILGSQIALATISNRVFVILVFILGVVLWDLILIGSLFVSKRKASSIVLTRISKLSAILIIVFALKILFEAILLLLS